MSLLEETAQICVSSIGNYRCTIFDGSLTHLPLTAQKVFAFEVILVRIFPHLD